MMPKDPIKEALTNIKPDHALAMDAIRKANITIQSLVQQLKHGEAKWLELFTILGTVLNKLGKEVHLTEHDLIPLDPRSYQITVEDAPTYADNGAKIEGKVIRLRAVEAKNGTIH